MMKKTIFIAALLACLTVAAAPTPDDKPPPPNELPQGHPMSAITVDGFLGESRAALLADQR